MDLYLETSVQSFLDTNIVFNNIANNKFIKDIIDESQNKKEHIGVKKMKMFKKSYIKRI